MATTHATRLVDREQGRRMDPAAGRSEISEWVKLEGYLGLSRGVAATTGGARATVFDGSRKAAFAQ